LSRCFIFRIQHSRQGVQMLAGMIKIQHPMRLFPASFKQANFPNALADES
jgi:hypothetical protein